MYIYSYYTNAGVLVKLLPRLHNGIEHALCKHVGERVVNVVPYNSRIAPRCVDFVIIRPRRK